MAVPLPVPPADDLSFDGLVARHQANVWRYLRFLGARPVEADELTQDAFVAVLDKPLARFGADGAGAYLRRVARNLWLKRRPAPSHLDLAVAEEAFIWFRHDDDGGATLDALRRCLEVLSAEARRALDLRFAEQRDRRAIGAALGLGEEGVKSLLQRTYARLRACIEERRRRDG